MEITPNIPIEVNERQYKAIMKDWSWVVAGRTESGKYFIKVWMMKYKSHILAILKKFE